MVNVERGVMSRRESRPGPVRWFLICRVQVATWLLYQQHMMARGRPELMSIQVCRDQIPIRVHKRDEGGSGTPFIADHRDGPSSSPIGIACGMGDGPLPRRCSLNPNKLPVRTHRWGRLRCAKAPGLSKVEGQLQRM